MAPAAHHRRGGPAETAQRVFHFGKGRSDGNKAMKDTLGGKGANLAEMATIGLSVPPGFTVYTEACRQFQLSGGTMPPGLWDEILDALRWVEGAMDAGLGDSRRPLLLSVRSGAAVSMPGMMDTVLNLGLNDHVVAGLAERSGRRFAYDSYRRFLDMFGDVGHDVFMHVSNGVPRMGLQRAWLIGGRARAPGAWGGRAATEIDRRREGRRGCGAGGEARAGAPGALARGRSGCGDGARATTGEFDATCVVMGIPHGLFEEKLEAMKIEKGLRNDTELSVRDLEELVSQYKNVYVVVKGEQFPSDPKRQLHLAVLAVFD
ncbi:hypothetical protein PR202_ga12506 [Eleusine coracana subsp. coracana]|uniref:Pyruvate phosphate dikinase AMP/ATP-binding domain-containing protein n=1 Tax=Eleusine coracana subsp. coracana TaxID=191504 RepID=A0AAV5CBT7_ELECO|nr:hypothetical protein PR202_ga12506 [Eleusine coracana subsp. coracana]